MKRPVALVTVQAFFCTVAFSQNPRWEVFGTPIPAHLAVDVRWEAAANPFPSTVWVYRLTPNKFSTQGISNLSNLCSFDSKDETESKDGVVFQSHDGNRKLSVNFSTGAIYYDVHEREYGPTNLAVGVPAMSEMPGLATNVLHSLGLSLDEITGYFGTSNFELSEPSSTTFFVNGVTVTNIPSREVYFRRSVDGIPVSGGDSGAVCFGEHERISRIRFSWHGLERLASMATCSQQDLIRLFRKGKWFQGSVPGEMSGLNWLTVKSVTIKKAKAYYCSGRSDLLYPFVAYTAAVETREGIFNLELDSPMVDESQPLPIGADLPRFHPSE